MSKYEYINRLKAALADLPANEKEEIIADYNEHFRIGLENGQSEEQIATYLGLPETVAAQFVADFGVKPKPQKSTFVKVLIAVAIIFFNVTFILGPFLGIVGTLIGFYAASGGIAIGGAVTIIVSALSPFIHLAVSLPVLPIVGVLTGIGLTCLGILFLLGTIWLTKLFIKLSKAYFELMLKLINE
jgi:uncharacterized membrane protein